MKEQLVSLETAKLAKEKGFKWNTFYYHSEINGEYKPLENVEYSGSGVPPHNWNESNGSEMGDNMFVELFSAPTQSTLQKWLREKHSIIVWANPIYYDGWHYLTEGYLPNGISIDFKEDYNDEIYEEAIEVGLKKALTYIK